MRRAYSPVIVTLMLALGACAAPVPGTPEAGASPSVPTAIQGAPTTTLAAIGEVSGIARAPIVAAGAGNIVAAGAGNVIQAGSTAIVAQGGGNLVAQGGGNIVAAGAGNYRIEATDDDLQELPLVGATVFARDARTLELVPGLAPVRTDGEGAFRFSGVPAGTTVLIEVMFVGKDRKAARMTALAKAEAPGGKRMAVSTATTLVCAQVVKSAKAGGDKGQIELMARAALDEMADAMQTALAADAGAMREATKAVALEVPKEGDVTVERTATSATYQPASDQADTLTRKDARLQARVKEVADRLAAPLDEAQEKAIALLRPLVRPTTVASADPGRATADPAKPDPVRATTDPVNATADPGRATAAPSQDVTTAPARTVEPTTTSTATPVIRATATPLKTPAPTPTPVLRVSLPPIIVATTPPPIIRVSLPPIIRLP
ncbi:MAG: hypothetical protein JWM80_3149 [Cyanobacteria bacterium RYN_339]|nr:hypothetical protein [Cyanobacteria bacterium RYN_339]